VERLEQTVDVLLDLVVVRHLLHTREPRMDLGVLGKVKDAHRLDLAQLGVAHEVGDRRRLCAGNEWPNKGLFNDARKLANDLFLLGDQLELRGRRVTVHLEDVAHQNLWRGLACVRVVPVQVLVHLGTLVKIRRQYVGPAVLLGEVREDRGAINIEHILDRAYDEQRMDSQSVADGNAPFVEREVVVLDHGHESVRIERTERVIVGVSFVWVHLDKLVVETLELADPRD
jgi:hypothetical protein